MAATHAVIKIRSIPDKGEQVGECGLHHGIRRIPGDIADYDSATSRRFQVYVVDSCGGLADEPELRRP